MPELSTPSEIAREVLRRLATQRIQPTPENFRELYNQIAGSSAEDPFPERQLRLVAAALPRASTDQLRVARRFESALSDRNWQSFKTQLAALLAETSQEPPPWGQLIRELVLELQRRQTGQTSTAKQQALSHVLESSHRESTLLFSRLQALVKSWSQAPTATFSEEIEPAGSAPKASTAEKTAGGETGLMAAPEAWRRLLAQTLESITGMLMIDTPELTERASTIAAALRAPTEASDEDVEKQLQDFAYRLEWAAQDQSYIRRALLNLLQLVIENISELMIDDKWMHGQMSVLLELFSRPLDKNVLDEMGERLRDVIYKQGTLKRSLSEAQNRLRDMLAHFVDRLGELAESTGNYHQRMGLFAERVTRASSIDELSGLIDEVVVETRTVESRARRSQEELRALRATVDQANREIARLEEQLEQASALVRHDPLTGTLNRKGLDEMLAREVARMQRRGTPLCVALLDVDDFKKLNDSFGHATGDEALKHLAAVIRENLRPQDSCGRYGGEEFLVVLPDTQIDDALTAMARLQRELTKRFFLHDNQKLLITFSAGVTQVMGAEELHVVIDRADKAMYRAKRAGKNRVEGC